MRMVVSVVVIVGALAACANVPPGQLTDADFYTTTAVIDGPQQDTAANFRAGLRRCGDASDGLIFVTQYGIPDCESAPLKSTCDMYAGSIDGGRSGYVIGRVDFMQSTSGGTNAEFRVRRSIAHAAGTSAAWLKFASGRASEVCKK